MPVRVRLPPCFSEPLFNLYFALLQYTRPGQNKRDSEALRSSPVIGSVGVEQRVGGFPASAPYQTVHPALLATDARRPYHSGVTTTGNSHRYIESYQPKTTANPRIQPAAVFPSQRRTLSTESNTNAYASISKIGYHATGVNRVTQLNPYPGVSPSDISTFSRNYQLNGRGQVWRNTTQYTSKAPIKYDAVGKPQGFDLLHQTR
jgi:hypothetical protein